MTDTPETIIDSEDKTTLPPTTTAEENRVTKGQRNVSLVWEYTQALIALTITFSVVATTIMKIENIYLVNVMFLIVGFYFSRTNHQAVGGVGYKTPLGPYVGR